MAKQDRVQNSALWAAAADAAGWISELVDVRGLRRRIGATSVSRPVGWKRKIGGLGGVQIELPAGTYSDDTQLRLAVCRAIGPDGSFDAEAFAKVELPVWSAYSLGAGRGTKAAAANLSKRDVTWFSNFFASGKGAAYVEAGGNGAAMRIQPHVWANLRQLESGDYLANVVRDALITHGHMIGVCGAVFHARCLAFVATNGAQPSPSEWCSFVEDFVEIEELVRRDPQLSQFWLSAWEQVAGRTLKSALSEVIEIGSRYVESAEKLDHSAPDSYVKLLDVMECRGRYVGAGLNTAIAAAYLAWSVPVVENSVRTAINVLGSDTDTIGTMVGALAGYLAPSPPEWKVQDYDYISMQAQRISERDAGQRGDNFAYPDLASWRPPHNQSDALGVYADRAAVRGLGGGTLLGDPTPAGDFAWQWVRLDIGQSVLCKSRIGRVTRIPRNQLPMNKEHKSEKMMESSHNEGNVGGSSRSVGLFDDPDSKPSSLTSNERAESLDDLTDRVIRSQFDSVIIGDCFKAVIAGPNALERSIAFAAIVSKAITARRKKGS